jgi:hypothetical protein
MGMKKVEYSPSTARQRGVPRRVSPQMASNGQLWGGDREEFFPRQSTRDTYRQTGSETYAMPERPNGLSELRELRQLSCHRSKVDGAVRNRIESCL